MTLLIFQTDLITIKQFEVILFLLRTIVINLMFLLLGFGFVL